MLYRYANNQVKPISNNGSLPSAVLFATTTLTYNTSVQGAFGVAEWGPTNLPWSGKTRSQIEAKIPLTTMPVSSTWPSGITTAPKIVDLASGGSDFQANIQLTLNANGRCIIRLPDGIYILSRGFTPAGGSGNPTYAFGYYDSRLQGFCGDPSTTFVRMGRAPLDAQWQSQMDYMASMTQASFAPLQMGSIRADAQSGSPLLFAGVTFDAEDQPNITQVYSDVPAVVPQPAPHQGFVTFNSRYGAKFWYCRWMGFGRAMTGQPPFEMGNVTDQYGHAEFFNCESDGRLNPAINSDRPRRCTFYMGNSDTLSRWTDSWLHHTNVSRYAVNDEGTNPTVGPNGVYDLVRCRFDHVGDSRNVDPALNNGATLGSGDSSPACMGFESSGAAISLTDVYAQVDNADTTKAVQMHISLTTTGANRQGGRMTITRGTWRNFAYPALDGYLTMRVHKLTYWWTDTPAVTIFAYNDQGARKTPLVVASGQWPPSVSTLSSAGATPQTHYLVMSDNK